MAFFIFETGLKSFKTLEYVTNVSKWNKLPKYLFHNNVQDFSTTLSWKETFHKSDDNSYHIGTDPNVSPYRGCTVQAKCTHILVKSLDENLKLCTSFTS